ncbi:Protein of unknown function [Burkholderia sp. OK233]|nr:Protein of unknown function [Burkholderia sp. OK233]
MNQKRKFLAVMSLAALALFESTVVTSAAELTVAGAESEGSKDGAIPAYESTNSLASGWTPAQKRIAAWKYKGEKPLFVISAANVAQYADKLTPGQLAFIKQNTSYTMPVYPSHRDCQLPDFVQNNTKANAGKASIGSDGWTLENAVMPAIPFPKPKTGIEAVWNFLTRYQGAGVDYEGETVVGANPGQSNRIIVKWTQTYSFPWGSKAASEVMKPNSLLMGVYYAYSQPAALAGQAVIQRNYVKEDSESYYYFTGQRRVRRLPSYAYDAPLIGYENQALEDQAFLFYGLPDRFDWKLLGKKEVYVPYNSFGMVDPGTSVDEGAQATFLNPNNRRYELHRVWVVEGTVKAGVRHTMPKKTLYLDEDSWVAVAGEDYDSQGKIWKAKEAYPTPIAELGGACVAEAYVMYDVNSGRYLADGLVFDAAKPPKFYESNEGNIRLKDDFFTMQSLQQQSQR